MTHLVDALLDHVDTDVLDCYLSKDGVQLGDCFGELTLIFFDVIDVNLESREFTSECEEESSHSCSDREQLEYRIEVL